MTHIDRSAVDWADFEPTPDFAVFCDVRRSVSFGTGMVCTLPTSNRVPREATYNGRPVHVLVGQERFTRGYWSAPRRYWFPTDARRLAFRSEWAIILLIRYYYPRRYRRSRTPPFQLDKRLRTFSHAIDFSISSDTHTLNDSFKPGGPHGGAKRRRGRLAERFPRFVRCRIPVPLPMILSVSKRYSCSNSLWRNDLSPCTDSDQCVPHLTS